MDQFVLANEAWNKNSQEFLDSIEVSGKVHLRKGDINNSELVDKAGGKPVIKKAYEPCFLYFRRFEDNFLSDDGARDKAKSIVSREVGFHSKRYEANAFNLAHLEYVRDPWTSEYSKLRCCVTFFDLD